jgi:hypothetical protein
VVSEILGHANISITLDIYTHVLPDLKKEVASKLNHFFDTKVVLDTQTNIPDHNQNSKRSVINKSKAREFDFQI